MEPKLAKKKSKFSVKKTPNAGTYRPDLKVEHISLEEALDDLSPQAFRSWVRLHLIGEVWHGRKVLADKVLKVSRSQCDHHVRELRLKGYLWVSDPGSGSKKTIFKLVRRGIIPRKTLFLLLNPDGMAKNAKAG